MWLLWAVDGKKYVAFYIFSILVCIVKEDAPLYVVCIGMYMFFENKKNIGRINGIIMAVIAGGYMMFITNWLTENGDGQMMTSTRFGFLNPYPEPTTRFIIIKGIIKRYRLSFRVKKGRNNSGSIIWIKNFIVCSFTKRLKK